MLSTWDQQNMPGQEGAEIVECYQVLVYQSVPRVLGVPKTQGERHILDHLEAKAAVCNITTVCYLPQQKLQNEILTPKQRAHMENLQSYVLYY
jgi:hypothetical protein